MKKKKIKVELTEQELEDLKSGLSFFIREYEKISKMKCPDTKKGMAKLLKKLWSVK